MERKQTFHQNTIDRLATTVRWSESFARGIGSQYSQYQPLAGQGFWAIILDKLDTTDSLGNPITVYSWEQYFPAKLGFGGPGLALDSGNQGLLSGLATDINFAFEVNGNRSVPFGTLTWLRPSLSDSYFLFEIPPSTQGFWAKITARPTGADSGEHRYSWQKLVSQAGGGFTLSDTIKGDLGNPDGWAVDVQASPWVLTNERVWMIKAEDHYEFNYNGGLAICSSLSSGIGGNNSALCTVNGIDQIRVFNPFNASVAANTKLEISYSPLQTKWFVVSEQCSSGIVVDSMGGG